MHLKIYLLEQESHSRTNVGVVLGVFSCFLFFPFSLFALEELYGKIYHSRLGGSVLSGGLSSVSWMTSMLLWFFFSLLWWLRTMSGLCIHQSSAGWWPWCHCVGCGGLPSLQSCGSGLSWHCQSLSLSSTSPSEENLFSPWRLVPERSRRLLGRAVKDKMEALKTPYTFFSWGECYLLPGDVAVLALPGMPSVLIWSLIC